MTKARPLLPIADRSDLMIQITDDQSRTLMDTSESITFHSASGAASETRHVYLQNSGVLERLSRGLSTSVLEVGLGTGMGLLMTLDAAISSGISIHYHAIDQRLLESEIIGALKIEEQLKNKWLVSAFLAWRNSLGQTVKDGEYLWTVPKEYDSSESPDLHSGNQIPSHRTACGELPNDDDKNESVCHSAGWGEKENAVISTVKVTVRDFRDVVLDTKAGYDAVYYDPFAPAASPELWQAVCLRHVRESMQSDGVLSTYCVSRQVREVFERAGFSVNRVRGPVGGKREVLVARPHIAGRTNPGIEGFEVEER